MLYIVCNNAQVWGSYDNSKTCGIILDCNLTADNNDDDLNYQDSIKTMRYCISPLCVCFIVIKKNTKKELSKNVEKEKVMKFEMFNFQKYVHTQTE